MECPPLGPLGFANRYNRCIFINWDLKTKGDQLPYRGALRVDYEHCRYQ